MNVLGYVLMAVGLVGMIVCSKKQKTNPALQPVAFVLFLLVVAGAVMSLKNMLGGGTSEILSKEMAFSHSRGYVVGKFLAGKNAGKKVLLIADPLYGQSKTGGALIKGLKEGYGSDNVVLDNVKPAKMSEEVSIEEVMTPEDMDNLLAAHSDAGVVITTIGLPQKANRMKYFSQKGEKPVIFLLSTGMGGNKLDKYIAKGEIAGGLVNNLKADLRAEAKKNPEETFAIRYVLVTKDNIKEYAGFFE